jgi:hypothetical protein
MGSNPSKRGASTRRTSKPADAPSGIVATLRRPISLRLLAAAAVVLAPVVAWLACHHLASRVSAMPEFHRPLTLKWVDLPAWLREAHNRHVLDELARRVRLTTRDRMLDGELATRIGHALCDPGVGWVKSVQRIRVQSDGDVLVRCSFRRPFAWVRRNDVCYLIDEEAVRLPGVYDAADCSPMALAMIEGAAVSAPPVGRPWPGDDVQSGLVLAALLEARPFRHQVASVNLSNFGGRRDRSRPHIELATDRPGARIWWGRAPGAENGTEITANQKLVLLETLFRQWGRIDMNRAYVNIMTWPDRVAMPATMRAPVRSRLIHG